MQRNILLAAGLLLIATSSFSQTDKVEEVGGRAVDKADQRVDRKIDQGIDSGLDKLEGVFFGKKSKSSTKASTEGNDQDAGSTEVDAMPTTGGNVTIEENTEPFEALDFTGSYRMVVHSYKNGSEQKDSPAEITMAFNTDHMAMVPKSPDEKGDMRMVYDLRNKNTYTLITDEKGQRTGMKMKMMKVNVEGDEKGADEGVVTRTDEMRTIEGYKCRKYIYKGKDGSGEAWIAEDVSFDMMAAFRQMVGGKKVEKWQNMPHNGVAMENTWNSADGKEKVTMFTKDLVIGKVDESLFSTSGFEVMDMTGMPLYGR